METQELCFIVQLFLTQALNVLAGTLKISWTFLELAMKTDLLCATALHTAAIHACDGNSHLPKIAKNNGQAPLCSSVLMGNVLSFSSELCHRLRCPVKVVKITYMLIVCFYF